MENAGNGRGPPGSPGLIYASQSHLNNASSASTSRTGVAGAGGSGQLLNSTPLSPSISSPPPPTNKIGIYGWRKRCLYLLILVILVVAILNLALTVWIIRVVHLSSEGLGPVKIADGSVHISGDAEILGALHASEIKGVGDAPLVVEATDELRVEATNKNGDNGHETRRSSIALTDDQIRVSTDDFWVKNCAGDTLLRSRNGADLEIGAENEDIGVKIIGDGGAAFDDGVVTSKIEAPPTENLEISSRTNRIDVFGARGVQMIAKSGGISLKAMDDISITSKKGNLVLDADIQMLDLPLVGNEDGHSVIEAYQLCVCESGRLYLAEARGSCARNSNVCP